MMKTKVIKKVVLKIQEMKKMMKIISERRRRIWKKCLAFILWSALLSLSPIST
jgi:hypothetical protein